MTAGPAYDIAVIIPLIDDHGLAERCVQSWDAQEEVRAQMQLVVVDHGIGDPRASALRGMLRPGDVWLHAGGASESDLYHRGVLASSAPLLLFTEAHCVAGSSVVAEVLRSFRQTSWDAATVDGGHLHDSALLTTMQTALERQWSASTLPTDARRVSLRGFAIRRETYDASGGFHPAHERFCDTALGIALVRRGVPIARVGAPIAHGNCAHVRELVTALRRCALGQAIWREQVALEAPHLADSYLGTPPAWNRRAQLVPATARRMLHGVMASLLGDLGRAGSREKARQLVRSIPWLLVGCAADVVLWPLARVWTVPATLRWWVSRFDETRRALRYRELWEAAFDRGFLEAVAARPLAPHGMTIAANGVSLREFPDGALAGFHPPQPHGESREASAVAMLHLALPPRAMQVCLDWELPRTPQELCLTVFWNGRRVAESALQMDERGLKVSVRAEECSGDGPQDLLLTARAFQGEGPHERNVSMRMNRVRIAGQQEIATAR
jgi:hypothetical protein